MMNLDEWLFDKEITPDILVKTYGFRSFPGEEITLISSAPNEVKFGRASFIAGFVFYKNQIDEINLLPIIEGAEELNYPTKEYQEIKMSDCTDLLSRILGEPIDSNDVYKRWKTEKCQISCYKVVIDKGKCIGGDIIIHVR